MTVAGGAVASLAGPILLSHYIDAAQAGVMTGVTLAAGLYILTATALPVLSVVENWLAAVVAWRSTNRIRVRLFRHCLDQDLELLERHPPGALITRIDGDVEMLNEFLSTFVVRLLTAALVLAGVIVVMARLDWRLARGVHLSAGPHVMQRYAPARSNSVDGVALSLAGWRSDAIATRRLPGDLMASPPTHLSVGPCIQVGFDAVLGQAASREYSLIGPCARVRRTTSPPGAAGITVGPRGGRSSRLR